MASTTEGMPRLDLAVPFPIRPEERQQDLPALQLTLLCASVPFFLTRRLDQIGRGHTPAADLLRTPYDLARKTQERLQASTERLMGHPDAARLRLALKTIEVAGAMTMALHDRVTAELRIAEAREARP